MHLDKVEMLALQQLFSEAGAEHGAVLEAMPGFEVIERTRTRVGFFSIIRCSPCLTQCYGVAERSWRFKHALLDRGGFFVCWPDTDSTLCLEAVANRGAWPLEFMPPPLA